MGKFPADRRRDVRLGDRRLTRVLRVRLGDDADAGPASVAEQSNASIRGLEGTAKQGITCEVSPAMLGDAVRGARAMGWAGFHCSIPHKVAVIDHLDGLGKSAEIMQAILDAGEAGGIMPYGVETRMALRLEKGFLHVGSDTDGSSTPDDVGWGHVARKKTTDYIGKRSLYREGNLDKNRKQFVGLDPLEPEQALRPGGHLLIGADRQAPATSDGWITSACYSPNLERHIALGMLRGGSKRSGEILTVCDEDERFNVRVVSPAFYDPDNIRLSK